MSLQAVTDTAAPPASDSPPAGLALTEALLEAALQAQRNGSLEELVRSRALLR
jgi:hypothetical protein